MADLSQLETALINADKAGDTEAAKVLAGEITRLRGPKVEETSPVNTDPAKGMPWYEKAWVGMGSAIPNLATGVQQLMQDRVVMKDGRLTRYTPDTPETRRLKDQVVETRRLEAPLGNWGTAGKIFGNVGTAGPLLMVPGANTALGSAVTGGLLGGLQPVGEGESRETNAKIGMGAGAAGYGLGAGLGNVVRAAGKKASAIEASVKAKAAEQAAAETASARSAAGQAAQNAYRQLEHLRELGAMRALTPEEAQIAAQLEKELAGKAVEKLIPAAAEKEATASAFKAAAATESQRAAELAAQKLSGSEIKQQIMARLKRYGPAAVGGAIGHFLIPGLGAPGGAAVGLVLRPAIRSAVNLTKNPAVQHGLLSRVGNIGLLADENLPIAAGLLGPSGLLPYTTE